MTLKPENSVCLASIFGHVGVNKLNSVISDWSGENGGHWNLTNNSGILGVNTHNGS
jgi:hypothetical protein